jgi:hypothetical protein
MEGEFKAMNSFNLWRIWLFLACLAMAAFGLTLALGSRGEFFAFFMNRIDPLFWGAAGPPVGAVEFQRWIYGAWGATVAGWGLMMALLAWVPWGRRETWARNTLAASVGLWFVVDTILSFSHGVWINVALNIVVLLVLGLPVFMTWRRFGPRT